MSDTLNLVMRRTMALLNTGDMKVTDTQLRDFAQAGYASAARILRASGMGLLRKQSDVIDVAVGKTKFTRAGTEVGAVAFPSDMIRPIELRERVHGTTTWATMKSSDGFLPPDNIDATIKVWDWRGDSIVIPDHATSVIEVEIQYEAELDELAYPSDVLLIPDGLDPVSRLAAAFAASALGDGARAAAWKAEATSDLTLISDAEAKVKRAAASRWGRQ